MSEEEKKAIEKLKEEVAELKKEISGTEEWVNTGYEEEELEFYNVLLNLIIKQQKEIEDWKFTTKYVEDNYIYKDKIREKIKELKTKIIGSNTGIYSAQIDILNELLEE